MNVNGNGKKANWRQKTTIACRRRRRCNRARLLTPPLRSPSFFRLVTGGYRLLSLPILNGEGGEGGKGSREREEGSEEGKGRCDQGCCCDQITTRDGFPGILPPQTRMDGRPAEVAAARICEGARNPGVGEGKGQAINRRNKWSKRGRNTAGDAQ